MNMSNRGQSEKRRFERSNGWGRPTALYKKRTFNFFYRSTPQLALPSSQGTVFQFIW